MGLLCLLTNVIALTPFTYSLSPLAMPQPRGYALKISSSQPHPRPRPQGRQVQLAAPQCSRGFKLTTQSLHIVDRLPVPIPRSRVSAMFYERRGDCILPVQDGLHQD